MEISDKDFYRHTLAAAMHSHKSALETLNRVINDCADDPSDALIDKADEVNRDARIALEAAKHLAKLAAGEKS